jgi:hypothetical protein
MAACSISVHVCPGVCAGDPRPPGRLVRCQPRGIPSFVVVFTRTSTGRRRSPQGLRGYAWPDDDTHALGAVGPVAASAFRTTRP